MNILLKMTEEKPLKPKTQNLKPDQRGVAVIFAVLLMGLFLSITLTLSAIFVPKIRISSDVKNSVGALYAAESGVEWCIYINFKTPLLPTPSPPVMSNGATYINGNTGNPFIPSDCRIQPIKSAGSYNGVTRI